jgi:Acetyltransferases
MRDDRSYDEGRPFARFRYRLDGCTLERLRMWNEALAISEMLAAMPPWQTLGYSADQIARYLVRDDPGLFRYLVRVGDDPAGVLGVRYPWLRGATIEVIGVAATFQHSGLGSSLVDWLVDHTRSEAENLWAVVSAFNSAARRFYNARGFVEVATLPELICSGYDEILVRKRF